MQLVINRFVYEAAIYANRCKSWSN